MKNKKLYAIFLTSISLLSAQEQTTNDIITKTFTSQNNAWFTGPCFTRSGKVLKPGEWNVRLSGFALHNTYAVFDNEGKTQECSKRYQINPIIDVEIGLCPLIAITASSQMHHIWTGNLNPIKKGNISSNNWGDSTIGLRFAALEPEKTYAPKISLAIIEVLPSGKYQELDPTLEGTDISGAGAYRPSLELNISKNFFENTCVPISLQLTQHWHLPANVTLEGFSVYGGGPDTKGTMRLSHGYAAAFSIEAALNRRFELINEIKFQYEKNGTFTSTNSQNLADKSLYPKKPETYALNLSHGVGVNFTENFGMVAEINYSVLGKNAYQFIAGVFKLGYAF